MDFLLFLWELPQNILGLLVIFFTHATKVYRLIDNVRYEYYLTNKYNFGVSLGRFIIIGDTGTYNRTCKNYNDTILHEYGHRKQSLITGFLYLLVIGLPSLIRNLWDTFVHKDWTYTQRIIWYYSSFPERQADELGGVHRF